MKKKFSIVSGVALTLILLASLFGFAVPVAAATLTYSTIPTPNLVAGQLVETDDVDFLLAAPDGSVMFAYGNTDMQLRKSTNGGKTWAGTAATLGIGLNGTTVVAMAISPNYATDLTIVAADADQVFVSSNGGISWAEVSTALFQTASGAGAGTVVVTSIDIAPYYSGGALAILVGTADTTATQFGKVVLGKLSTWTWTDQVAGSYDFYAVAFSPNHQLDAEIMAVGASATATVLTTKFATNGWGVDIKNATISTAGIDETELTQATIAFADDYEWVTMNRVLVGTTSSDTAADDVFLVMGAQAPAPASLAVDLNVAGLTYDSDIHSIDVNGSISGATVMVGLSDSTAVMRTLDPSTSVVAWIPSTKAPIGSATAPNTIVSMASDFATSNTVYVGTQGDNSAFSVSADGGIIFNGLSLIDVSDDANLSYIDVSIVDANTMFLLVSDSAGTQMEMLFRTTDGGTSWQRVWVYDAMSNVEVSPNYATDSTVYVAQTDTRVWRSTDGGGRFVGLTAPAAITALTVVDGSTYFTGHSNLLYKGGSWIPGSLTGIVNSIAVSPNFATDNTIFVGTTTGDVYKSVAGGMGALLPVGVADELGAGSVIVVPDPNYATNSIIYAGSTTATEGFQRWVEGTNLVWDILDTDPDATPTATLICNGIAISAGGTLYVANGTADRGIRRTLYPTITAGYQGMQSMTTGLPAGSVMESLAYMPGSNVLYSIVSAITTPSTAYPHGYALMTITDTMAVAPTLLGPADEAQVETSVELTWDRISVPAGTMVAYEVEVGIDSLLVTKVVDTQTYGTGYVVTGLTPGRTYWWQIYGSSPLTTLKTKQSFVVKLGGATMSLDLSAPTPGATDTSIRPNFQWAPVAGATSYELQLADNSAFTGATKKTLTVPMWAVETDLNYSTVYYWQVKAVSADTESAWRTGIFTTMAEPVVVEEQPPVVVEEVQPPDIIVEIPAAPAPVSPGWIWAIVIIGAILVIAVIVLIVRTRRPI